MTIKMGAVKMGGAVVDSKLSVNGGVKIGGGGSAPVTEARWGQIEGNINNQTDLMNALALKADAADLSGYATTEQLAAKADASELANYATDSELAAVSSAVGTVAAAVDTKLTTPSGTNGQFMSLVNGVWTAVNLPTYEGGVN